VSGGAWLELRALVVAGYDDLRRQLARRLGSDDRARDVLHDTYLRLDRTDDDAVDHVDNPGGYLIRMAMNLAKNQRRAEQRLADRGEAYAALHAPRPAADAARPGEAIDTNALRIAVQALPERRRYILLAASVEGLSQDELALQLGITRRTVAAELRKALAFCLRQLREE
jgi:RNA polymerase sigma-70 factor (ECF subfamily)